MPLTSLLSIHPYVFNPDITHSQPDKHLQQSFARPNPHFKAHKQDNHSCQGGGEWPVRDSPLSVGIRSAPGTAG